jgi:asparagine synthetase B (glutamine-hydrolysing)
MNRSLPNGVEEDSSVLAQFLDILTEALSIRTRTIPQTHSYPHSFHAEQCPRVAVLFSGGLDCSVLAWLIHKLLPPNESIDLINVAFENPRTVAAQKTKSNQIYSVCPDRITGRAGWEELRRLSSGTERNWRFVEVPSCHNIPQSRLTSLTKRHFVNARKL